MSKATAALEAFHKRMAGAISDAAQPAVLKALGEKAVELIVRRTRLGFGVERYGQSRFRLAPLSQGYIYQRERDSDLSSLTTAKRSNLTRTGQMLDSMAVIEVRQGSVVVGPTGGRDDGVTNMQVAQWVTAQGRPFNFLSRLEQEQIVRFYRNRFGDLLRNRRLT